VRRVLILGSPGSGKSTLARELAVHTKLPLIHLDQLYWRPNWTEPPADAWQAELSAVLAQNAWVMDGNYTSTIRMRLERADTAIVFDFPRHICMARALRRSVLTFGRVRSDMAPGCAERIDLEFLRYIWTFRKEQRPMLMESLKTFPGETIFLRTPADVGRLKTDLRHRKTAILPSK
jgi:adenylate kinase family enzyme